MRVVQPVFHFATFSLLPLLYEQVGTFVDTKHYLYGRECRAQHVVTVATADPVKAAEALDRVVPGQPDDDVSTGSPLQIVVPRRADDRRRPAEAASARRGALPVGENETHRKDHGG
jgi:hypothetical protein